MVETKKQIEENCRSWANAHLKTRQGSFEFREHQLEHIVDAINYALTGKKTYVVEAPTGSGKSLIAMITCGVLSEYYGKRSYILVSDLGLLDQYASDFRKYGLPWGIIKGLDNYECVKSDVPFSLGECRLQSIPYSILMSQSSAMSAGYPCAGSCEYIQARKRAMEAPVTLMTYQFFLIQRNLVASMVDKEEDEPFDKRDFLVADEAHKLCGIIQSQYSPVISDEDIGKVEALLDVVNEYVLVPSQTSLGLYKFKSKLWPEVSDFQKVIKLMKDSDDKETIMRGIAVYSRLLHYLVDVNDELRDIAKEQGARGLKKALFLGNWARDAYGKFSEYVSLIDLVGEENLIKNPGQASIQFNCIYEDKMVQKYFHAACGCELLMSATIGNAEVFQAAIGSDSKSFASSKIPSTFDFTRSPILFYPAYKMSYKEKEKSLPMVCEIIDGLCKRHPGENGIIQTGSYDFMNKLYARLSPEVKQRVLFYSDTKEKAIFLKRFMAGHGSILMGPTLLEGLNFPDDQCRFMICMKLPYASLGDKLVSAKLEYLPGWYESDVCAKLEQGFGRGVRHKSDWCVTYVVDGCFTDVMNRCRENLSNETLRRIKVVRSLD